MAAIFTGSGNTLKRFYEGILGTAQKDISADDMNNMKATLTKKFSITHSYKNGRNKTQTKHIPVTVFKFNLP